MAKNPRGLGARGGETLEEKRQLMGGENNSILELSFQMGETPVSYTHLTLPTN